MAIHALVLAPFRHGPLLIFLEPPAVGLIHEEIEALIVRTLFVGQGGHTQRVVAARRGTILVNDAAVVPHEGAGLLFVVQQFQGDHRQIGFFHDMGFGINGQKFFR